MSKPGQDRTGHAAIRGRGSRKQKALLQQPLYESRGLTPGSDRGTESRGHSERRLTPPRAASRPECLPTNENKPPRSLGNFGVTGRAGGTLLLRRHRGGSEDRRDEFSRPPRRGFPTLQKQIGSRHSRSLRDVDARKSASVTETKEADSPDRRGPVTARGSRQTGPGRAHSPRSLRPLSRVRTTL